MNTFFKRACSFVFLCFGCSISLTYAQDQEAADSLTKIYQQNTLPDSLKLELLRKLSFNEMRDLERGLKYADELIQLSERTGNERYLRMGYYLRGTKNRALGKLDKALGDYFKSAAIASKLKHTIAEGESYAAIGDTYSGNNHQNAMEYYYKGIALLRQSKASTSLASALSNTGDEFFKVKKYDSALLYFNESRIIFEKLNHQSGIGYSLGNSGMVYASIGQTNLAEKNINEAIRILEEAQDYYPICDYLLSMADIYSNKKNDQSALSYALRSLRLAEQYGLKEQVANASLKLSGIYERTGDIASSFLYYKKHIATRDGINNLLTFQKMADLRTNYEVSQKQILLNEQKRNEKNVTVSLSIILGLAVIILAILLRNNQNKQNAYKVLNQQKKQTDEQKAKAEDALVELQVTQKQLIQSAKMASLGELTAGVAHEIQNPLNFVNNFSELSAEQLNELREMTVHKFTGSDKTEADDIINNLENNLKKINDHGKRAESIVKGMLQHSRASAGKKEPTQINVLADEYLRLSYQGLRAKDKDFNANFTSHFDDSIGDMDVVPQDIGRVLLNLYNNAFYSVREKKKRLNGTYEPEVRVTTKKRGEKVELTVKDNGTGIPQKVLDKIFQPFFTTKPSGQGTGLGLSLSYDVIKAHGGDIKVETKEGEFAEFIIQLPLRKG